MTKTKQRRKAVSISAFTSQVEDGFPLFENCPGMNTCNRGQRFPGPLRRNSVRSRPRLSEASPLAWWRLRLPPRCHAHTAVSPRIVSGSPLHAAVMWGRALVPEGRSSLPPSGVLSGWEATGIAPGRRSRSVPLLRLGHILLRKEISPLGGLWCHWRDSNPRLRSDLSWGLFAKAGKSITRRYK